MRFGVDELLGELDVGDALGGHHQAEVYALEQEGGSLLQTAGDAVLTDQCPVPGQPALLPVL